MLNTFFYALDAILPLILLIALGYLLKQIHLFDEAFFKKANTLVFQICLPCLLFYNIYNIESLYSLRMDVVVYALIIIVILFLFGILTARYFISDPKRKGVILQCVFRSNFAIIGIPVAEALGGADAAAIASLLSAFSIPLYNIFAVISLSLYVDGNSKPDFKNIFKKIEKNPLIRGVLLGVLCLSIRAILPLREDGTPIFTIKNQLPSFYSAIKNLSQIASPLALLVLGGLFTFKAVRGMKREIIIGTVWRIILAPILGLLPAILLSKYTSILSYGMLEFPSLIALFGTPVAVSSAIMAAEMNNDETLAGQLVVWTSLASIFTLFIIIVIIKTLFT